MRFILNCSLVIAAAAAIAPGAQAQTAADAVYAVSYLDVGTNAAAQGVDLIKKYRDTSRREAANLEFTVLQETSRSNRFVIVEGWKDQAAFEGHDRGTAKAEFQEALKPIRNSPPDRHILQPFANACQRRALHSGACRFLPACIRCYRPAASQDASRIQPEGGGRGAL